MHSVKRLINLLALLFVVTACNQNTPASDTSGIVAGSDAWETALNSQDIDALVNLYTQDARLLPPGGEMSVGHDGIRAAFGAMIDAGHKGVTNIVEATVSGDVGYIVGTFTLAVDGKQIGSGKYIETWRRGDDGQWRIANDIFNNNPGTGPKKHAMDITHVVITHEVDDVDHWMAAWSGDDNRRTLFRANGAKMVHTFQSAGNPNLTGLVVAVEDMDAFSAMLESEEGRAAAAEDGVRPDTIVMLTQSN